MQGSGVGRRAVLRRHQARGQRLDGLEEVTLSLVEGRLKEHLVEEFPEDTPSSSRDEVVVLAGVVGPEGDGRQALTQTNARQHRWIAEAGRQERGVVRWGYKRMADLRVSTPPTPMPRRCTRRRGAQAGSATSRTTSWT